MKIIINGKFLLHKVTGVERYAREILAELDDICERGKFVLAIPPEAKDIPVYKNIATVTVGNLHNRAWEQISFPHYVHKEHGISLNLCNVGPICSPGITCLCDVKIKAHPEFFSRKFLLWYRLLFWNTAKHAAKIITISEFSKDEIIKYYHVDANRIEIIPCAWQHMIRIQYDEKSLEKYHLDKGQYFFSMSSMDPNKNFKWIAREAKRNPNESFVIAGSINNKVFHEGLNFDLPENMKLIGYVSDEEAKTLMRDCKAFIYPSMYEGFGIPPLEAIASGCDAVVVSDIPVMHELFGATSEYVDTNKIIELSNIRKCDGSVLDKYSWHSSAEKLLRLTNRY